MTRGETWGPHIEARLDQLPRLAWWERATPTSRRQIAIDPSLWFNVICVFELFEMNLLRLYFCFPFPAC